MMQRTTSPAARIATYLCFAIAGGVLVSALNTPQAPAPADPTTVAPTDP